MEKVSTLSIAFLVLLFAFIPSINSYGDGLAQNGKEKRCEKITKVAMCKGIGYNLTEFPNQYNHDTQDEAGMEVHQYWPLVEIKCSSDLRFFICSLYVPICLENYAQSIPPCRSVCERARYGCEPVMVQYGFQWPKKMKCDRFPNFGKHAMCMDEKKGEMPPKGPPPKLRTTMRPKKTESRLESEQCLCSCKAPLRKIGINDTMNAGKIETGGVRNCALPCHGGYESSEEKTFSAWWLSLSSGLCCLATFATLLTFLIDPDRLKYPERPIVYLSTCYFMVSVGYLIRLWKGHESIACKGDIILYGVEAASMSPWCTLVFLLIYYFGIASSIWWVVLSFSWFLASSLKWGSEAIAAHSNMFHLAAWVLPGLATLVAISDGAVDGDAISGICSVGNQDSQRLLLYLVGPLGMLLGLGTFFLLAGFSALFRIRRVVARQAGRAKTEKLEKLIIRIGVFSVLYMLPAVTVLGAYIYEMIHKESWINDIVCSCKPSLKKPHYSILMLKYFMSLAVGITSGVWIWSGKTVESWQRFLTPFCGKKSTSTSMTKFTSTGYQQNNHINKNLTHV